MGLFETKIALFVIDLSTLRSEFPQLSNIIPLAGGGQKEVCRATFQGRPVALKLIRQLADSEERTLREINAMRRLSSVHVPALIVCGEKSICGQNRHFIIEEYIDGETYRSVLRRQPFQPFETIVRLASFLLNAAGDFEKSSLVHRDLKPENLMIDKAGRAWVLDFGIARHLNLPSMTSTGGFGVGTIGYAPPEQYRNIKPEIDGRADLFAIGMILHESASGKHFYLTDSPDPISTIQKMDKVNPPRLSFPEDPTNEFSDFIGSLCQRFPSRRPNSVAQALHIFTPFYQKFLTRVAS